MAKTKNASKSKKEVPDYKKSVATSSKFRSRVNKLGRKRLFIILAITAAVLLIVLASWLIWELVNANNELHKYKESTAKNQQADKLTTEVSKVAVLPSGEDPVIASVSDVAKLKGKPFFANAQDGDKVLIYKQAKKAILYRPSTKQIVEEAVYDASTTQTPAK